jgi:hypothetical protein
MLRIAGAAAKSEHFNLSQELAAVVAKTRADGEAVRAAPAMRSIAAISV